MSGKELDFQSLVRTGALEIGDGYRAKNDELGKGGPIFLRSAYLQDTGFTLDDPERFSSHVAPRFGQKIAVLNDVVITTKGNSTGRVGRIGPNEVGAVYSPHLSYWRSCDEDRVDQDFLYYWSRGSEFRTQLAGMSTSTDMAPYLSLRDQLSLRITLPGAAAQRGIGKILRSLDDKIEVNRRMNETLEAMAQAIFRDWFVDFGPVRRKAAGETDPVAIMGGLTPDPARAADLAALFPSALDGDDLPEGWTMTTLGEYALLNPESWSSRTAPADIRYVDLSNTKWGEIESATPLSWAEAPSRARRVTRRGDTLVGTVRPGNGSYAYIGVDGLTASTGFAHLRPKSAHLADLVYLASTSGENIERLSLLADGGAYPAVNPSVVLDTPVASVPADLAIAFAALSSPTRALIEQRKAENHTLAQTRDYLLPRLMSGEVRVHDIDLAI